MTDVSMSQVARHDVENCAGSGMAAPKVAGCLGLAAAPTFALMALWTAFFGGQPDMVCGATQGSWSTSGMPVMYLLMSAFHSAPWLKLFARQPSGARGGEVLKGRFRILGWRRLAGLRAPDPVALSVDFSITFAPGGPHFSASGSGAVSASATSE
jgi:hypothetical protein